MRPCCCLHAGIVRVVRSWICTLRRAWAEPAVAASQKPFQVCKGVTVVPTLPNHTEELTEPEESSGIQIRIVPGYAFGQGMPTLARATTDH